MLELVGADGSGVRLLKAVRVAGPWPQEPATSSKSSSCPQSSRPLSCAEGYP